MSVTTMNRRDFLRLAGLGAAALVTTQLRGSIATNSGARAAGQLLDVDIKAAPADVSILPGPATRVLTYQARVVSGGQDRVQAIPNSYLGPIIRVSRGQRLRVNFTNGLSENTTVHFHGLTIPSSMSGHPHPSDVVPPGGSFVYEFDILDPAGLYFFHPHPHMRIGYQVYSGLAGLVLVTDDEEAGLGLPSGAQDVPLVIQDRTFDAGNQLVYTAGGMGMAMMSGFMGDRILVNGRPDSVLSLPPGPCRLRLLNGSNARTYRLAWQTGTPFTVIGTDGGLLPEPVERTTLVLAPGERLDLWVDLAGQPAGTELVLQGVSLSGGMMDGMMGGMMGGTMGGMAGQPGGMSPMGGMGGQPGGMSPMGGMGRMGRMGGMNRMGSMAGAAPAAVPAASPTPMAGMPGMGTATPTPAPAASPTPMAGMPGMGTTAPTPAPTATPASMAGMAGMAATAALTDTSPLVTAPPMTGTLDSGAGLGQMPGTTGMGVCPMGGIMGTTTGQMGPMGSTMGTTTGQMGPMGGMMGMAGMAGMSGTPFPITRVRVEGSAPPALKLPARLTARRPYRLQDVANAASPRTFRLEMAHMMAFLINGRSYQMEQVADDELVPLDTLELWQFVNATPIAHPMHIHNVQFNIVERSIGSAISAAYEDVRQGFVDSGWKDTVLVMPGETVKFLVKFTTYQGMFMYHCHILEHEDMGMMRNLMIGDAAGHSMGG